MPFYEVHIHTTEDSVSRMVIKADNSDEARYAALDAVDKDHNDVVEHTLWEDQWVQLGEISGPDEPDFNYGDAYWDANLDKWTSPRKQLFANEEEGNTPVGNPKRLGRSVDWTPYEDRGNWGVPQRPGHRAEQWTPPQISWEVGDSVDAYDLQECPWCEGDMEHEGDVEDWISYCNTCDGTIELSTIHENIIRAIEPPSEKSMANLADFSSESFRLTPTQRNFIKWLESQKDDDSYSNTYYLGDGWARVEPANRYVITDTSSEWYGRRQCPHPRITNRTLTSLIDKGLITVINNRDGSVVSSSNPPDRYFIGKAKLNASSFSAEATPKQLVEEFRHTVRDALKQMIQTIEESPNPSMVDHATLKTLVDTAFQLGYNSGNIDGKWEMKKDMMQGFSAEELETPIVDRAIRMQMMIERATRHAMFTAMKQQALLAMLENEGPWVEQRAEEIDFDWTPEEFGMVEPKELIEEIGDLEDHLADLENDYAHALEEDNEDLEYILEEKIIECREDIEYLIHLLYEVEAFAFANEQEEELI